MSARLGLPRRDVVIGLLVAAGFVAESGFSNAADGPFATDALFFGGAGLALMWRRRRAVAALLAAVALACAGAAAGTGVDDLFFALFLLVLPSYAVGHEVEGRSAWLGLLAGVALGGLATVLSGVSAFREIAFPMGVMAASFVIGRLLRQRTQLTRTLADEAAAIELDRELRAQAAVGEERARIAREMHDVVAHTMAVMVVQAGAARRKLARDPQAAEEALGRVVDTGRMAMDEMRRLLGFLREDEPAQLEPQPTLDDLGPLVQRARDAGLPVELRVTGEPFALDAGAGLAAYRVVQEALTNALKHAGSGARATVQIGWSAGALELAVTDTGGAGTAIAGSGHGLIGMRERVAMLGGELSAAPLAGGGFAVRARIPRVEVPA